MGRSHQKHSYQVQRLLFLLVCTLCLTGTLLTAKSYKENTGLSALTVQLGLESNDGKYEDIFVLFKKHPEFLRLSRKHRLDDPAVWPVLRKRFVLQLAELQEDLSRAESMMAAQDRRGGLDNKVVSAEKTRRKGRALRDELVTQMDELRQMLRLMDEFESMFEAVSRDHALTDEITIENKAGQGFPGQVLFIDGKDLIVKRQNSGYFRIPANLLNDSTKLAVLDELFSQWEELSEMEFVTDDEDTGELIAYDDSFLYINDSDEGVFSQPRGEVDPVFVSYTAQLESAREVLANETKQKDAIQSEIEELQEAILLNQSRVEDIDRYESLLGIELPVIERLEVASDGEATDPDSVSSTEPEEAANPDELPGEDS